MGFGLCELVVFIVHIWYLLGLVRLLWFWLVVGVGVVMVGASWLVCSRWRECVKVNFWVLVRRLII